jgi:signal transduction histidine kinase
VQPANLFRSTGFRLAAWYAVVFGASVAILLAVVYWIAVAALEQQLEDSVVRETRLLVDIYNTRGLEAVERGVLRRSIQLTSPRRYYLLQDAAGRRIAGNLAPMAPIEGRTVMSVPEPEPDRAARSDDSTGPNSVVAQGRRLAKGEFLLVGENRYRLVKAEEAIIRAVGGGIAITVLLALGGGMLLALGYLRRLEEVNRTSRSIMDGNLSKRVPTRGSGDEMDQLAVNLNAMLDRIQVLMESLKRVSDDIAHDLRTPLSRLRQRLEMARSKIETPADYGPFIEQSIAEVDAILDTFTALLRIAQVESGTRRSAFSDVNLEQVVSAVAETYAPVAEDRGQRLQAMVGRGAKVHGDRELLLQMIANLVENSIRHCRSGVAIIVSLTDEAGAPELRVTDTGPGIPDGEREKVFRRFYRLEASRTMAGNGLGLALVKAVAELHGASVELSDNHPGLCVTVRFRASADSIRPAQAISDGAVATV